MAGYCATNLDFLLEHLRGRAPTVGDECVLRRFEVGARKVIKTKHLDHPGKVVLRDASIPLLPLTRPQATYEALR